MVTDERKEYDNIYKGYVGIDESGRGTAAGDIIFVGVRLKPTSTIEDIQWADDSKKTSRTQRIEMAKRLKPHLEYYVARRSANDIDTRGLSACIKECLSAIKYHFKCCPIIYDGNTNYKVDGIETIVKGDAKVSIISAASIFAKLIKDNESIQLDKEYPEYGFAKHSGYVNEHHTNMIIEHGYCPYHRRSYNIKKLQGLDIKENVK